MRACKYCCAGRSTQHAQHAQQTPDAFVRLHSPALGACTDRSFKPKLAMADAHADHRARAKRQALSSERPSQQQQAEPRSHANTRTEYRDGCHQDQRCVRSHADAPYGDRRDVPSLVDAQDDSSSQHYCDLPDSQEGLADELADLCAFKSAGSGSRMRIHSPSSVAQVPPLAAGLSACAAAVVTSHCCRPTKNLLLA